MKLLRHLRLLQNLLRLNSFIACMHNIWPAVILIWPAKFFCSTLLMKTSFVCYTTYKIWSLNIQNKLARHGTWVVNPWFYRIASNMFVLWDSLCFTLWSIKLSISIKCVCFSHKLTMTFLFCSNIFLNSFFFLISSHWRVFNFNNRKKSEF